MKKIFLAMMTVVAASTLTTSCIEEIEPQTSTVTAEQAGNAPGSYDNFVNTITSSLVGQFTYSGGSQYPFDFGSPSCFLPRDVMGQDIIPVGDNNWFSTWYEDFTGLGPSTARSQVPWTYYYGWIKNCNTVISMAGADPDESHIVGAGIAHVMRAMFYLDLAQMYAPRTYLTDKQSVSVPIITEATTISEAQNNPRATNEAMYAFILSDLDQAEEQLKDFKRSDVYTPDLSVVYGLKARTYLLTGEWAQAEQYAKKALEGYEIMGEDAWTSRETGFNTPNSSWIFGLTFKSDDPNILENDADSSWGSQMILEITDVSGCGYAANYGSPNVIDRHLYETIPVTDWRKKVFVDFAIDDEIGALDEDGEMVPEAIEALKAYSDYPTTLINSGAVASSYGRVGGLSLKFRAAGGAAGHNNQYIGFTVAVPLMRAEEMKLIEAEAAGRQEESRGIDLLTAFARTRDANYVYGSHRDAYGNAATSQFLNEVWWQRRVELWGEGFATFDIKRLEKGIIRSYAGTNHMETMRFNTTTTPDWMNLCIVQTETNYNASCTNNPVGTRPSGDSEEFTW